VGNGLTSTVRLALELQPVAGSEAVTVYTILEVGVIVTTEPVVGLKLIFGVQL
jgi:hypothetical protein